MPDPISGAIGGSALLGASSAKSAAKAQSQSADAQVALQREIYDDTTARFAPYLKAGGTGLEAYMHELGLGAAPANYAGFQKTPGYDFQMQQGTDAVNALAGARGGLHSGRTMQDLTSFGQGLANQEYGNHLTRLAGITDMGAGAAGNQATAGNAFAANASNALAQKGNATSAGIAGMNSAIQNGIGAGINHFQYQNNLNNGMTPWGWSR